MLLVALAVIKEVKFLEFLLIIDTKILNFPKGKLKSKILSSIIEDENCTTNSKYNKENRDNNVKMPPKAKYDSRKDSVVENKVYPSLKPRTRSSLKSCSKVRDDEISTKIKMCRMPPKTKIVCEQNPMFSTVKKFRTSSESKLTPPSLYHLSNVIGKFYSNIFR